MIDMGEYGRSKLSINRSLRLIKTRNGRGAGLEIGFNFDEATLRFAEAGIVVSEKAVNAEIEANTAQPDEFWK